MASGVPLIDDGHVRVTYDGAADAAYIFLVDRVLPGEAVRTAVGAAPTATTSVNLDFDVDGRLLGVEVLGASSVLRQETLQLAARLDL